ncbi:MAG: hypothetical protein EAZ76_02155 [Nostocales cyanobacterium]|nr:MAG: hypothetical protein EAZ87_04695 [Nostocales cyanobacterium]TAF20193.1 MAG: hypothetical protein EAZ76_02155 [Nostocales cyanobacterium]
MNSEELQYQIFASQDSSYPLAHRYSTSIITNPDYSEDMLREIIKSVTWELRQMISYRSDRFKMDFGDKGADIAIVFLYKDDIDVQNHNYVCRSCWCSSELTEEAKQICFIGNDKLDEIEIDWNPDYNQRRNNYRLFSQS